MKIKFQFVTLLICIGIICDVDASSMGACTSRVPFSLDIKNGRRVATTAEKVCYDGKWYADDSATTKITVNDVEFLSATGVGDCLWSTRRPGVYELKAKTYSNGEVVGDVLVAQFDVVGQDLVNAEVSFPDGEVLCDGNQCKPRVKVVLNGKVLCLGEDYDVSYGEILSGAGSVIITGKGKYVDEIEKTFKIRPASSCMLDICAGPRIAKLPEMIAFDQTWVAGTNNNAFVRVMENGTRLTQEVGAGFYQWNAAEPGEYTLEYRTYVDDYLQGEKYSAVFIVEQEVVPVGELTIDWGQSSFVYDGQPKEPVITVKDGATTLTKGTHYLVEYKDNVNVGTANAIVKGVEPYVGEVTNTFTITAAPIGPSGGAEPGSGEIPEGGLSKFDATYVYDSKGHTINTQALYAVTLPLETPSFSFALAENGPWQNDPFVYTNVGEYVMWYKISAPNYADYTHQAKVTILEPPRVENVTARPRYPWNGLVDIKFTVTGAEGTPSYVSFTAKDVAGGTNLTMKTLYKADGSAVSAIGAPLLPGTYNWVWDATADLGEGTVLEKVVVEGSAVAPYWYVKFNANGGTGTMANEEFQIGVAKALTANAFIRTDYIFAGWATSAGGTKVYADKQSVSDLTTTPGATVNLYAVWEKDLGGVQLWENGPYWAESNVGATKPEESGYYFWWGDAVGYKRNAGNTGWASVKNGASFTFSEDNCPTFGKSNDQLMSAGYVDASGNLVAKCDAATAHLGAPWRMPTSAECSALVNNCTTEWTQRNGVWGRCVTGKGEYSSKSIFIPATGYGYNSGLYVVGLDGYYWFSTPGSGSSSNAWILYFISDNFSRGYHFRYYGQTVRPVR